MNPLCLLSLLTKKFFPLSDESLIGIGTSISLLLVVVILLFSLSVCVTIGEYSSVFHDELIAKEAKKTIRTTIINRINPALPCCFDDVEKLFFLL